MTLIIAEAGVNHNGDMKIAHELIKKASEAGADIVKFQTFSAESLATKYASKADYQNQTTDKNQSQRIRLKSHFHQQSVYRQIRFNWMKIRNRHLKN